MRFADPWWLGLVPVLVALLWWRAWPRHRGTVLFSRVADLRELPRTSAQRLRRLLPWIEGVGLVLLLVAMARPQLGKHHKSVTTEGVALMLVIDKSNSMVETDLDRDPWDRVDETRLDVVKAVVRDFVDEGGDLPGRENDLVGLISFAGYVQSHCPLTLDHAAFLAVLRDVQIPQVDRNDPAAQDALSTAIGDALVVAVDRLEELEGDSKVVVLLSDGESNIGEASPAAGAKAAAEAGITVHTVGVGRPGQGLDESTLIAVAEATGGEYFSAQDAAGLERIYARIDELERTEIRSSEFTRWKERFLPLLLLGFALLALHRVCADTRWRSLP